MPLLAAMLCALPALAEPGAGTASPSSWALGVGAITFDKAYAGIEREHLPLPFVPYENRWLSIAGPQVGFKLLELAPAPAHTLNLDLVVRYDGSGDDDIEDTPVLAGERKSGAWAGARIEWKSNRAVLGAEALGAPAGSLVSVEIARDSLSVRDHGPGVEAAQLALLFERFWRGPHRDWVCRSARRWRGRMAGAPRNGWNRGCVSGSPSRHEKSRHGVHAGLVCYLDQACAFGPPPSRKASFCLAGLAGACGAASTSLRGLLVGS